MAWNNIKGLAKDTVNTFDNNVPSTFMIAYKKNVIYNFDLLRVINLEQ